MDETTLKFSASDERFKLIGRLQQAAITLFFGAFGKLTRHVATMDPRYSKQLNPGSRSNNVHSYFVFRPPNQHLTYELMMYIDDMADNISYAADANGNLIRVHLTGYLHNGSTKGRTYALKQGWYEANGDTIANAIVSQNPNLFS